MTRWVVGALRLAGFAGVIAGVALSAGAAYADWVDTPEAGPTGHLSLRTLDLPDRAPLAPGTTVDFLVEASLADAEHASLALQLRADGALVTMPHGLRIGIESCTGTYPDAAAACSGVASAMLVDTAVIDVATPTSRGVWSLHDLTAQRPRQLRVSLSLPERADAVIADGAVGSVSVGLFAAGGDPAVTFVGTPNTATRPNVHPNAVDLAGTGVDAVSWSLVAAGAISTGLGAWLARRERHDPRERRTS